MTDPRSSDRELADRVAARLAEELELSSAEVDIARHLTLAGKKQEQAWFDLVEQIVDRHEGHTHDAH